MQQSDSPHPAESPVAVWRILVCCGLLMLCSLFNRSNLPVLIHNVSLDLSLGPTQAGILGASGMLVFGLVQIPAGMLADAFGGRRMILACGVLMSLGCLGFAFSRGLADATATRIFLNIGATVLVPATSFMAFNVPANQYARAMSVFSFVGAAGTVLATRPAAMVNQAIGWRGAEILFAALTLGATLLFFLGTRGTRDCASLDNAPDCPAPPEEKGLKKALDQVRLVLTWPGFWPLCIWQMTAAGLFMTLNTLWVGPYLMDGVGMDLTTSSTILGIAAVSMMFAPLLVGWLSDVVLRARRGLMIVGSLAVLAATLLGVFGTATMPVWMAGVMVIVLSIGAMCGIMLNYTMVKELVPPQVVGTAIGCVNMLYPLCTALMQSAFGVIIAFRLSRGATGGEAHSTAFLLLAAAALVACVCAFRTKETFKEEPTA